MGHTRITTVARGLFWDGICDSSFSLRRLRDDLQRAAQLLLKSVANHVIIAPFRGRSGLVNGGENQVSFCVLSGIQLQALLLGY